MRHSRSILAGALLLFVSLGIAGCHTNNLSKYNLRSQHVYYRSYVTGEAEAHADVHTPSHGRHGGIFADIGSAMIEAEVQERIERAAQPDTMAVEVSHGLAEALQTYLGLVPMSTMNPDVEYIVETELEDYSLSSNESGVFAHVRVTSRIVSRATAGIVWENSVNTEVPLRETAEGWVPSRTVRRTIGIINAARLASLSEHEISSVLRHAAQEAGHEMADELREDAAELPEAALSSNTR